MSLTKHDSNWCSREYFGLKYFGCNKSTSVMSSESSCHPHTAAATTLCWGLLTSVSGNNTKMRHWLNTITRKKKKVLLWKLPWHCLVHKVAPWKSNFLCMELAELDYSAFLKTNMFLSIYQTAVSGKGLTAKLQKCFYWGQYVLSANSLSSNANILILYRRIEMENGGCSSPLPKAMETGTNRALVKQQE